jgi:hypothetical protein
MKQEVVSILTGLKTSIIKYFILGITLLAPIKVFMVLVGLFIFLDTCFGVWAAKQQKKPLRSSKLARFISKLFVYNTVVITAYILDVNLLGEFFLLFLSIPLAITKITVIALVVNEVYSIDEKVVNVKGYGLWAMFKRLLGVAKFIKKQKDDLL